MKTQESELAWTLIDEEEEGAFTLGPRISQCNTQKSKRESDEVLP